MSEKQHHMFEINDVQNVFSTLDNFLWDRNIHEEFSEATTFSNFRRHEIYEKYYRHP